MRRRIRNIGSVLIASCLGDDDTGGGLVAFDGSEIELVDRISSTGLHLAGDRFLRLLWSSGETPSPGELLVYDKHGVARYYRIDELAEPHDITWDGKHFVIISTLTNTVLWITSAGEIAKRWRAPGEGDAWHLNSLLLRDDQILVTAFGKFHKHREWADKLSIHSGLVFDPITGAAILTGLDAPHHPRFLDGAWIVCNSATHELLELNGSTGAVVRRLLLSGWTRGIAVTDDLLFVGESANRSDFNPGSHASIAVVDRKAWAVVDRLPLACREVYDLVWVGSQLMDGIRRGFRTNHQRVAEQDQYAMFRQVGVEPMRLWATGEPLPPEALKVKIEAKIPEQMEPDSLIDLECTIENLGNAFFISAPPNPVHLSYKWMSPDSGLQLEGTEGLRSRLPQAISPRRPCKCRIKIRTPPTEGTFILRLTLVQELVAWFDDLDEANSFRRPIRIVKSAL
ncbi:MAG: DUF4915 domain-containing protein [Candidatus Binatia bacterium]